MTCMTVAQTDSISHQLLSFSSPPDPPLSVCRWSVINGTSLEGMEHVWEGCLMHMLRHSTDPLILLLWYIHRRSWSSFINMDGHHGNKCCALSTALFLQHIPVSTHLSTYLPTCQSICLPVNPSTCRSIRLPVDPSVYLSIQPGYLSICISVTLSVYPCACLAVCLPNY